MENRFIVLVDFSESSRSLLHLAWDLSHRNNSAVVILHQSLEPLPVVAESEMKEKIKDQHTQKAIEKLKQFTREFFETKRKVTYQVSREHLAEQIQSLIDPNFNDIVLTGLKPKSLPEQMLFGSSAARLANLSDCTIIAVPEGVTDLNTNTLCVSLSPKYPLNELAFERLLSIRNDIRNITFINIFSKDDEIDMGKEILNKAKQKYANHFNVSIVQIKGKEPGVELENHMKLEPALLVLQRGSRKLSDVLRRFFVNRFIYSAERPIVILP